MFWQRGEVIEPPNPAVRARAAAGGAGVRRSGRGPVRLGPPDPVFGTDAATRSSWLCGKAGDAIAMWLCSRSFSRMVTPPLSAGPEPLTDGPLFGAAPRPAPGGA